jgi:hypothetical protein
VSEYRNILARAAQDLRSLPAEPQGYGASLTMPSPGFVPAMPTRWNVLARLMGDPVSSQAEEQRGFHMANLLSGFAGSAAPGRSPLLYHGSPRMGLTQLVPSERGPMGPATYLSPARRTAEQYARGGRIYEADFPADIFHGAGRSWLPDDTANPFQIWRDQIARVTAAAPENLRADVAGIGQRLGADDGYRFYYDLARLLRSETAPQDILRRAGFRGISGLVDGPEVAMFGPVPVR